MHNPAMHDTLLSRCIGWAMETACVRALALVGSLARSDRPADVWSDIDLLLTSTQADEMCRSNAWVRAIGEPQIATVERGPDGEIIEHRVLLGNGIDVDFLILPAGELQHQVVTSYIGQIMANGWRSLVDKDGELAQLRVPGKPRSEPLTEARYLETVNDLLFHAVWTAKKLARGELWTAKQCCDSYMKEHLLSVIRWQIQAADVSAETWYSGRFIEQWASPGVLHALTKTYAHYDRDDVTRALWQTLRLVARVARDLGQTMGYAYPLQAERYAFESVAKLIGDEADFAD